MLTGRDRLRHDAVELADRYRHLLTPPGTPRRDLVAAVIEAARQRARTITTPDRDPAQLTLDLEAR